MWIKEIVLADLSVLTDERRMSSDPRIAMLSEAWHYCIVRTSRRNAIPELGSELLAPVVDCETLDSLDAMSVKSVPEERRVELLLELSVSSGFSQEYLVSADMSDFPDVVVPMEESCDPSPESVAAALHAAQRLPEALAKNARLGEKITALSCADAVAVHCSNMLRDVLLSDYEVAKERHAATGDRMALLRMRGFARRLATVPRRELPKLSDADREFLKSLGILK
ncbi:MAG: hypothetical protein MJ025_04305 [Victivallaceae bacterium]|nr:hypothetical protein [Victivallaceae bacterium]